MIATLPVPQELDRQAAEPNFLDMLPTIRRVAHYAFRRMRSAVRKDLIAEVVANAFAAFRRLIARGRAALIFPTVLAKFAIRQVRTGRRVGSKRSVLDVLSPYAQRGKGFAVESLQQQNAQGRWEEL